MDRVANYLESIINDLEVYSGNYTIKWLNAWLDKTALRKRYGENWEMISEVVQNHHRARGYVDAVGAVFPHRKEGSYVGMNIRDPKPIKRNAGKHYGTWLFGHGQEVVPAECFNYERISRWRNTH